ncbi:MAG TPA: DNA-binding domain-containing protein [Aquabacterium sp.]|uniref:DNA-binding domain-containing protein n=1 Tax=Aquabacterium sp. TaxID=1872578 RepID=UPI002E35DDCE|nr:DNA-binding domain-containing protein [Aquabacterium sp.]HEX5356052.1 DNA-binding domain-containing protein [Aquabacterium sp.]
MTTHAATMSLSELQARMQAHVLSLDDAALQDVCDEHGLSAQRRLGIYHHAYRARLLETMRDTFAHTWRYLGDEWFDRLALAFVEQHPSTHANLRWYGQAWPAWLDGNRLVQMGAGVHPEVSELAQLDWALRRAFDAADAVTLTPNDLAAMPVDEWARAPLHAHASVALVVLRCNALALWHALDQDEAVPEVESLPQSVTVLVWRHDERPHFRSVSEQEAQALTLLLLSRSFEEICATLSDQARNGEDAAVVAASLLRGWLRDGLLVKPASVVAGQSATLPFAEHHA